jgi:hypothetical protein
MLGLRLAERLVYTKLLTRVRPFDEATARLMAWQGWLALRDGIVGISAVADVHQQLREPSARGHVVLPFQTEAKLFS